MLSSKLLDNLPAQLVYLVVCGCLAPLILAQNAIQLSQNSGLLVTEKSKP